MCISFYFNAANLLHGCFALLCNVATQSFNLAAAVKHLNVKSLLDSQRQAVQATSVKEERTSKTDSKTRVFLIFNVTNYINNNKFYSILFCFNTNFLKSSRFKCQAEAKTFRMNLTVQNDITASLSIF